MLKTTTAPYQRLTHRPLYHTGGVLICLIPITLFSCLYYGFRPLIMVAIGMVTAILTEILCCAVAHRRLTLSDGSAAVTGALIGAMMSPLTPYWVPVMGALFAIGVAKMPFGGIGRNVFNPAAAGMAFCAICFPTRLFEYPDPTQSGVLPLWDASSVLTANSPMAQLSGGGNTTYNWISLLSGEFPGPIGAAGILVLAASAIYLITRGSSSAWTLGSYLFTCFVFALLFPRAVQATSGFSLWLELCTGLLLFCGVFLLADPVTAPRYRPAQVCYGVLAGLLVMLLRRFGRYECCDFFAVMLANSVSSLLDRGCWHLMRHIRGRKEAA